jgi:WD40 repeat protein/tRNA A-37 threonylcarbamoyl transferase component Bud32
MSGGECYSEHELQRVLLGELPEAVVREVTRHLESCPRCADVALRVDDDTDAFLHSLRRVLGGAARSSAPGPSRSACRAGVPAQEEPLPESAQVAVQLPAVAGFEILEELGRGGSGVVYKARQEQPARIVALKLLLGGHHAGSERLARFLAEGNALARLQHPHIVQVFEVGEHQGMPFLVLEYMAGGSLAQRWAGAPQPAKHAARLVECLARAVEHAHTQGVIHRDLKPANILLTEDGTPKVADFGLAKQERPELTASGAILGTPSYMAPEQAAGDSRATGPAADVWALGAILYELLTGRPPFRAATVLETLEQVRLQEPVSPSQLQPGTPHDLSTVCLKCLQKEPARRYASAGELAEDLQRFLGDRPVKARQASAWEQLRRWARRNPALARMTAAVLVLVVVLVVGSMAAAWRMNRVASQALQAERDKTDQLFDALHARAQAGRASGKMGQRTDSLRALYQAAEIARQQGRPPEDLAKLRNEAIACLALPDLRLEQDWQGNPPGTTGLNFDSRFERYAWSFQDQGIYVCRAADHSELFHLPVPQATRVSHWLKLHFSPDGRYLAAWYFQWAQQRPLEVWDLQADGGRRVVALPDATCVPEFTADSRALVACLPDAALAVIDLPSGVQRRRLPPGWRAEGLALHPAGRLLAVASTNPPGVQVRDLETDEPSRECPHPAGVQGIAWAPDGRRLAAACNDHKIYLWDPQTGQSQGSLTGHRWEVQGLAFDPSGRWLASFGWDMTLRLWEVGSGRQLLQLEDVRVLDFCTQGGLAAAGLSGQRARVWRFCPSAVYNQLHCPDKLLVQLSFSPDGRWLTSSATRAPLRLWDVAGCREVTSWPSLGQAQWEPGGSGLVAGGPEGLVRLAVEPPDPAAGAAAGIHLQPPRRLSGIAEDLRTCSLDWVGESRRRLLMLRRGEPHVWLVEVEGEKARQLWRRERPSVMFLAASRDGRLAATGSLDGGNGICVWEADTGRLVRELPTGDAMPAFSFDGRLLYTSTGRNSPRGSECRIWRIDSWEPAAALPLNRVSSSPGHLAVASDGLLAVAYTMNDVRLLDPQTLAEVATLADPEPGLIAGFWFSPDGSMLAVTQGGGIHLWDLRVLRAELAQLGLDWDRAPYPPTTPHPS